MSQRRVRVIINPASASGVTGKRWPQIAPLILKKYPQAELCMTEYAGHGKEWALRSVKEDQIDQIIAVGGDGTIHEVLNGLFDEQGQSLNPEMILSALPMGVTYVEV